MYQLNELVYYPWIAWESGVDKARCRRRHSWKWMIHRVEEEETVNCSVAIAVFKVASRGVENE